ncbi:MAG: MotA/TolQ/ExbB proton channel family protein [Candidatus Krumholzibacteria bacterium]|nr:MotA/TolQ/ExbB proton channel family protein [Candidatus Krumholzibacteria bacterium]
MARHAKLISACFVFIGLGWLALAAAAPALAQQEEAQEALRARYEKIEAPSDSLGFVVSATDSMTLLPPVVVERGGLMGMVEKSPIARTGFGKLFISGGNFMWWLLFIAIVGMVFIIERMITLSRAKVNTRKLIGTVITTLRTEGVQAAAEECQKWRGPIAAILYSGLQKADRGDEAVEKAIGTAGVIEMSFLERGLVWVSSVTTIAPLVGFLGTVSGMINAFEAIAQADQVNAKLVASGISEALITTATGLTIAIPATLGYNYFVSAIDRFTIEMEEAAMELIEALDGLKP